MLSANDPAKSAGAMNCPKCQEKALTRGGGGFTTSGRTRYYTCQDCDIVFSEVNGVTRVLDDEPLPFRNRAEALRSLYLMVAEDKEWFGAVLPETEALAREIFKLYLIGNRRKAAPKPAQRVSFGRGQGRAALSGGMQR